VIWHFLEVWALLLAAFAIGGALGTVLYMGLAVSPLANAQIAAADAIADRVDAIRDAFGRRRDTGLYRGHRDTPPPAFVMPFPPPEAMADPYPGSEPPPASEESYWHAPEEEGAMVEPGHVEAAAAVEEDDWEDDEWAPDEDDVRWAEDYDWSAEDEAAVDTGAAASAPLPAAEDLAPAAAPALAGDHDVPEDPVLESVDDEPLAESESDEAELAEAELADEALADEELAEAELAEEELAEAKESVALEERADDTEEADEPNEADDADDAPAAPVAEPAATSATPLVILSEDPAVEAEDVDAVAASGTGVPSPPLPGDEPVMESAAGPVPAASPDDGGSAPGADEEINGPPPHVETIGAAPVDRTPDAPVEGLALSDSPQDASLDTRPEESPVAEAGSPAVPVTTTAAPEPVERTAAPRHRPSPRSPSPADPGPRPLALPGPRNGVPDNLQRIRGIGQKNEELLNALGIYHFGQIAAWTPAEARWVANQLAFPERVERDDWIGQAIVFATGGDTGYVKAPARRGKDEDDSPVAA
jgi:predicted flap endonuclease-1-like 5' DNA nuclease